MQRLLDPYDFWVAHDRQHTLDERGLPTCDCCGDKSSEPEYYRIDGYDIHEDCLFRWLRENDCLMENEALEEEI